MALGDGGNRGAGAGCPAAGHAGQSRGAARHGAEARPGADQLEAASWAGDYKSNSFVLNQVVITQGTTRLQADRAHASGLSSGVDFGNSRWTFDGNVRIDGEQRGKLRSDEAVVEFHDNRIARATVTGKPANLRAAARQLRPGGARSRR